MAVNPHGGQSPINLLLAWISELTVCYLCVKCSIFVVMALAYCESCNMPLIKPYIRCVECSPSVELCLCCFSGGFEQSSHKSDHMYEIIVSLFTFNVL